MSEEIKRKRSPVLDVLESVWHEYCSEDAGSNGTEVTEDGMSQLLRDLNDGWSLVDAIDTIVSLQKENSYLVAYRSADGINELISFAALARSAIKSGEEWSEQLEKAYSAAILKSPESQEKK